MIIWIVLVAIWVTVAIVVGIQDERASKWPKLVTDINAEAEIRQILFISKTKTEADRRLMLGEYYRTHRSLVSDLWHCRFGDWREDEDFYEDASCV